MDNLALNAEREKRVARNLLDGLRKFYENPENRKAYEAWKNSPEGRALLEKYGVTE